jgi:VRR-NUC domain
MPKHYRHRTDSNQSAIAASLKKAGFKVIDLSAVGGGCPDLLLLTPSGELKLIEVKNPQGRNRLTQCQKDLIESGWPVVVIRSEDEAEGLA